jgi:hypothetical protein
MDGYPNTVAPKVVNGINLDDLFALIEGVRMDPAKGKTHWRVATTWQGQTRSRAEVEGFGIGGTEVPRCSARRGRDRRLRAARIGAGLRSRFALSPARKHPAEGR